MTRRVRRCVTAGFVDLDREGDPVVKPPRRFAAPDLVQERLELSLQVGVGALSTGFLGNHFGVISSTPHGMTTRRHLVMFLRSIRRHPADARDRARI